MSFMETTALGKMLLDYSDPPISLQDKEVKKIFVGNRSGFDRRLWMQLGLFRFFVWTSASRFKPFR